MALRNVITVSTALAVGSAFAAEPIPTLQGLQQQVNDLNKRLDEAEERTDDVEFAATLDKIKFGLEFANSVANFNVNNGQSSYSNNNKIGMEVRLNMNAQINERTKFTGRLSIARGWGDMNWNKLPYEISTGRTLDSGAIVYLERAYIDYILFDGFVATLGRQPATDGPGSNLRNSSGRMSTYPALLVNVLGDALIFTYAPPQVSSLDLTFRAGYSKVYQWMEGNGAPEQFSGNQKDSDADLWFAQVESKVPIAALGDNIAILGYAQTFNHPLPPSVIGSASLPTVNLGSLQLVNFHFENDGPFNIPFHWFVSGGYVKGHADSGDDAVRKITDGALSSRDALDNAIALDSSNPTLIQAKAVSDLLKLNEKAGFAVHVGARYDLPWDFKIGYEHFYGSRYWYAFSRPSIHDPLDFRNTRGHVNDVYLIYQMDFNQFLRASYTHIHNQYTNNGLAFGGAEPVDNRKAEFFMLMYNLKF